MDAGKREPGCRYATPRRRVACSRPEPWTSSVLRADFDSRDAMRRGQPHLFYFTDHYRDYPVVLVRLSAVRLPQLQELLADSWGRVAPRKPLVAARPEPRKRRARGA
jgi:hypothetical protein